MLNITLKGLVILQNEKKKKQIEEAFHELVTAWC